MPVPNDQAMTCNHDITVGKRVDDVSTKMAKLWLLSSGLVFLAWLINENIPPRRPPLVNWGKLSFTYPSSINLSQKGQVSINKLATELKVFALT